MRRLILFWRERWDEILILGVAIPVFLGAVNTGDLLIIAITGVGLLVAVAVAFEVVDWLERRRRRHHFGESIAFQLPRRAIIFTVGNQTSTVEFTLTRQNPEYVVLICTAQSLMGAQALRDVMRRNEENCKIELVDAWDIRDARTKTSAALDWLTEKGVDTREMVVDVTGGTTPMSLGVFSMANEYRVDSQYIKSQYQNNRPVPNTQEAILLNRFGARPVNGPAIASPSA